MVHTMETDFMFYDCFEKQNVNVILLSAVAQNPSPDGTIHGKSRYLRYNTCHMHACTHARTHTYVVRDEQGKGNSGWLREGEGTTRGG